MTIIVLIIITIIIDIIITFFLPVNCVFLARTTNAQTAFQKAALSLVPGKQTSDQSERSARGKSARSAPEDHVKPWKQKYARQRLK